MDQLSTLQNNLEGLPGYDIISNFYNDKLDRFNSIDPFEDENGNKRRLSKEYNTSHEHKLWKKVQSIAWAHDKCFLGSCKVGLDCGLGQVPLVVLILPVIGPLMMYIIHSRLITFAEKELRMPNKLSLKMHSNIVIDLIITFPPLIGSFFGWMHGCSTKNAAIIYHYLEYIANQRKENAVPTYIGTERYHPPQPSYPSQIKTKKKNKNNEGIVLDSAQQSGIY